MNRPTDLTSQEYTATLFMLNRRHWIWDMYGKQRPPTGQMLADFLNVSKARGYHIIHQVIAKGYLDADFKPTDKSKDFSRSLGTNSLRGMNEMRNY